MELMALSIVQKAWLFLYFLELIIIKVVVIGQQLKKSSNEDSM